MTAATLSFALAIGCSTAEEEQASSTPQAWRAADVSPAFEAGVGAYSVTRAAEGRGFVLTLWPGDAPANGAKRPLRVLRADVEAGGRMVVRYEGDARSAEWSEGLGLRGDAALLDAIRRDLAVAALDAVYTLDLVDPATPLADPSVLSTRAGLIDFDGAAPLVEGAEEIRCSTGLAEAVAALGALVQLGASEGGGAADETGGVGIASNDAVGASSAPLLDSIERGVASAASAAACGNGETLVALANKSQSRQSCTLRGIQTGAGAVAVSAIAIAGACTAGTLVTTLGTGTAVCLAPAAGAGLAAVTGLLAGGAAYLICGGTTTQVFAASTSNTASRTCTDARFRELRSQKSASCRQAGCMQGRNCRDLSCDEFRNRYQQGETCLRVRGQISSECYGGQPDPHDHPTEEANEQNRMDACLNCMVQKGCSGGR
jgi:hypothetical protein